jgi:CheY-like chemotaxis protein
LATASGDKIMQQMFEKYGREQLKIVAVSASVLSHQHKSYLDAGFDDFIDKPVLLDRVYGCLTDLLGVTFVYGDAKAENEDVVMKEDLGEVVIDRVIWVALKEAAENHSITELRQHLAALEEMGDAERQMAQQRFDMAGRR